MSAAPSLEAAPARPRRFRALDRDERFLFLACLLTLLAVWAARLVVPAYSMDDYILLRGSTEDWLLRQFVTQGRFGEAALHFALVKLGVDPAPSFGVANLAALGLLALAAVWVARSWRLAPREPSTALVAALFFTHPFCAEVFTFRIAPINFALAVAMASAALAMLHERGLRPTPVALMALSFSVYQVSLNVLLVALTIGALLSALRTDDARHALRDALLDLSAVVLACVVYVIANTAVQRGLGIAREERAALIDWREAPRRIDEAQELLIWILFDGSALSAPLLRTLVLGLLAGAVATFVWRGIRRRAPALALIGPIGMSAALLAVPGLILLLQEWWPAARSLAAMGLLCGGALALCVCTAPARLRSALYGLGALVLFGFAGVSARVADEQQRINARDREIAREILGRLTAEPGFADVETVIAVNAGHSYPLRTAVHRDLNASALTVRWALPFLAEELLGRRMRLATAAEIAAAEKHCASAPRWPLDGSVSRIDRTGVGCF